MNIFKICDNQKKQLKFDFNCELLLVFRANFNFLRFLGCKKQWDPQGIRA